jgi:hypothetical protein
MKYVLLFGSTREQFDNFPADESERVMGDVMRWFEKHAAAGEIVGGERLALATSATTFRGTGSAQQTIDGPFIESKEEVSGFAIVNVADLDAALALARSWPALQVPGESVEVRPLFEM